MLMNKWFKYYDLDGSGSLSTSEFQKALEKMGVILPTLQDT